MSNSKWFVDESETDTVILDEGSDDEQWVKIKTVLSIADQDALGQLLMEVKVNTEELAGLPRAERRRLAKEGKTMNAQYKPSTVALLQVSIVDWSFLDVNNNKIPLTAERIGKLKPEWANQIEEAIDFNNPLEAPTTQQPSETHSKDAPLRSLVSQSDS